MSELITRRTFLRGSAGSAGALALLGNPFGVAWGQTTVPLARAAAFSQGIASGQPTPDGITLWTRLDRITKAASARLEVFTAENGTGVVKKASVIAAPETDFTARLRVTGLEPGREYFYKFFTQDGASQTGRFRTPPPTPSTQPVRLDVFSCQEYIAGYYHGHRDLAQQDDIDLVLCLGDYVYEQGFATTGNTDTQPTRPDRTGDLGNGDVQRLAEYRQKYNLYNTDPDLIEMRRRHPMMAIWDDHEVEDNYAGGRPGGQTPNAERRQTFTQRRRNGYQAFFEHMPRIRVSQDRIYGSIPLGNVEVFLLDTRQYRDDQPCNPTDFAASNPCPPSVTDAPGRTLLGATQKRWLKDGLERSKASWKIVANQVMITSLDIPARNPLNTDSWDGYGAERRELIDHIGAKGIENVSFVTGDIHTFFAGDCTRTGRQTVRGVDSDATPDGPRRATELSAARSPRRGSSTASSTGRLRATPPPPPTPRCWPTTRRSSTPTRPTRATRWSRRGRTSPCSTRRCASRRWRATSASSRCGASRCATGCRSSRTGAVRCRAPSAASPAPASVARRR